MNSKRTIIAYELLFRSGTANWFNALNPDSASSQVISLSGLQFMPGSLTGATRAFINIPRNLLLDGSVKVLPPGKIVIEVLEDIEPDEEVLAACRDLKNCGYLLALDDFVDSPKFAPLVELADIIKVDILATKPQEQAALVERLHRPGLKFLAEKVETWADFELVKSMGYTMFQGYYFSKPELLSDKAVPSHKFIYLELIKAVANEPMNFKKVEELFKRDVGLSFKLLRLINSALFSLSSKVTSIGHALVMLGEQQIRRLASLTAVAGLCEGENMHLLNMSSIRAKFLESLAEKLGHNELASELFLIGLLSPVDAILDKPMSAILDALPTSENLRQALLHKTGPFGIHYRICLAIERGIWDELDQLSCVLDLESAKLVELYNAAIQSVESALPKGKKIAS
ncbi:MAG: HDOD domain-containing protein [bacterium]|nr:HDOD domain-containing protein [bacterium]